MKSNQRPAVSTSPTKNPGAVAGTENQPIEVIPGRLFWISDKNPPKSRQHAFYFCIDNDLVYEPFFADFGPLDLGKVHLFCKELEKLMNDA